MTFAQKQDALVDEINSLGDCFEQYSYLIFRAGNLPSLPESMKTEENLVRGCQSVVWVKTEVKDHSMHFQADSETLIMKGILAILSDLVNNCSAADILRTPIDILERTELAVTFESERMSGIKSIIREIKMKAQESCSS